MHCGCKFAAVKLFWPVSHSAWAVHPAVACCAHGSNGTLNRTGAKLTSCNISHIPQATFNMHTTPANTSVHLVVVGADNKLPSGPTADNAKLLTST